MFPFFPVPIFPRNVFQPQCTTVPIFPGTRVSHNPQTYVSPYVLQSLCSPVTILPSPYVSQALCHPIIFSQPCSFQALCSPVFNSFNSQSPRCACMSYMPTIVTRSPKSLCSPVSLSPINQSRCSPDVFLNTISDWNAKICMFKSS